MSYITLALLFLARFLLFPIYFLSGFIPRDSRTCVFGSWGGHRFADNGAAFFLYCHTLADPDYKLVWISRESHLVRILRSSGFTAYKPWSPGGIAACLSAQFYVFDCFVKDINFWLSRGATTINLWSGVPLKVFERSIDVPGSRYYSLFHGNPLVRFVLGMMMPWHVSRPDLLITSSDETREICSKAFAMPEERIAITGLPRNDRLLNPDKFPNAPDARIPRSFLDAAQSASTLFIYLPTFRDSNKEYMNLDGEALHSILEELDAYFFLKTHPMDKLENKVASSRIIQLPQEMDLYAALADADVLISDYSSIIFDFMLLNKQIIYYTPDLEEFMSGCRSMNFHPSEVAVGPMCSSFEELLGGMKDAVNGNTEKYADMHRRTMGRIHKYADANSCERVRDELRERYQLEIGTR